MLKMKLRCVISLSFWFVYMSLITSLLNNIRDDNIVALERADYAHIFLPPFLLTLPGLHSLPPPTNLSANCLHNLKPATLCSFSP
jgi:hypothetical protein